MYNFVVRKFVKFLPVIIPLFILITFVLVSVLLNSGSLVRRLPEFSRTLGSLRAGDNGGGGENYVVKRVIDGDTVEFSNGERVRYLGMDTPELGQGKNPDECFAMDAKKINEDLVLGKTVQLEFEKDKYDTYGRTLAWVLLPPIPQPDGLASLTRRVFPRRELINLKLVEAGAGKFYWTPNPVTYKDGLIKAEEEARLAKRGLWGVCGKINNQCLVKGNLDRNDKRYYHLPGFKYYNQTQVNLDHGDKWFCSEEEAIKAGFKRAIE